MKYVGLQSFEKIISVAYIVILIKIGMEWYGMPLIILFNLKSIKIKIAC